jgi:hypothetical protein
LLSAKGGKFTTPLAKAIDEANKYFFSRGIRFVCSLPGHRGLAGENELRDVGESDCVTPGDALAGELPDEIAEEEIHFVGGGEAVDVGEKLGGEGFGVDGRNGRLETADVVGAERWTLDSVRGAMVLVDQHVAAPAFGADVLALMIHGSVND